MEILADVFLRPESTLHKLSLALALLFAAGLAQAQPRITGGPVNAASYIGAGRPNANIAQGSMFILFGESLGPQNLVQANSLPLQGNLSGTVIRVTVGGTNVTAYMIYTSFGQVAAVLPSNTPVGDGTLTLTFNNQTSAAVPIRVSASTFGMFTRNSGGTGPAIVQNFISQSQQPTNSLIEAAQPGQTVILWGTGLGPVTGNEAAAPLPGDFTVPVEVYVGNVAANVAYKGRSGCCVGIDQVVFTVPQGVEGCYVPVAVRAGNTTSNIGTMSISATGRTCSDLTGLSAADVAKLQNNSSFTVADISLSRAQLKLNFPGAGTLTATIDDANGAFKNFRSLDLLAAAARGAFGGLAGPGNSPLPSTGCTVSQFTYKDVGDSIPPVSSGEGVAWRELDAGTALNLTGAAGTRKLTRHNNGTDIEYYPDDSLGFVSAGTLPGLPPNSPLFLEPGNFTVDNGTGSAVGAFRATVSVPAAAPTWTNQDSLSNIPRSQDLQITWSGATSNLRVALYGSSADPASRAGADFACIAPSGASSLTVPSWILAALPASGLSAEGARVGFLGLGAATLPVRFQATGVDAGFISFSSVQTRNAVFQ